MPGRRAAPSRRRSVHGRRDHEASGGPFRGEEEYQDGVQHGVARVWWLPTGKLNHEQEWVSGQPHGTSRGWFSDGRLRSEEVYERGLCVRRRTWDEGGALVEDREGIRDESGVLVQDVDGQDPASDISDWFSDADEAGGI